MTKENAFQASLIREIKDRLPGSMVLKNDANYIQGVPDLSIFYKDKWAMLECKKDKDAKHQPNQNYYIDIFNGMSFASFIYPENKEEVLDELQRAFESQRKS